MRLGIGRKRRRKNAVRFSAPEILESISDPDRLVLRVKCTESEAVTFTVQSRGAGLLPYDQASREIEPGGALELDVLSKRVFALVTLRCAKADGSEGLKNALVVVNDGSNGFPQIRFAAWVDPMDWEFDDLRDPVTSAPVLERLGMLVTGANDNKHTRVINFAQMFRTRIQHLINW